MENNSATIPNLLKKTERLTSITVELYQLKMLKVGSTYLASIVSRLIISTLIFILILFASIGTAFYCNDLLGSTYLGFFCVAAGYLFLALILVLFRDSIIKRPVQNSVVRRSLNHDL
jgi:hypothetical protein